MQRVRKRKSPYVHVLGEEWASTAPSLLKKRAPVPRRLRVAGLFAGIGGVELGLSRAGHESALLCEKDDAAMHVLKQHFDPEVWHGDVRTLDELPEGTTLLAGGFPCQDLSQAGRTRGIRGKNSGLVGEVFRLLETCEVPWLLLENVPFMLQLGGGAAMDLILGALEDLGYKWAYRVVDSRSFGFPQRRQRVVLVATHETGEDPRHVLYADDAGDIVEGSLKGRKRRPACGFYWTEGTRGLGWAVDGVPTLKGGSTVGIPSPPAIWMPNGSIVKPDIRDAERLQGFEADWTKPAEEVTRPGSRWRLVGNAVTVDLAHWVGARLGRPKKPVDLEEEEHVPGSRWPTAAFNVGDGRRIAHVSKGTLGLPRTPLSRFLAYPTVPLSRRATEGFRSRFERSSLQKPPGFLEALERHLDEVE